MTRLHVPEAFHEQLPPGDYEVLYVRPAAGVIQIAPSLISVGQTDKPKWCALQRYPGVRIECAHCGDWFDVTDIPIDEIHGWRCLPCRGGRG